MVQLIASSLGATALRALVILVHALVFVFLARRASASLRRLTLVLAFAVVLLLPVAFALVPAGMVTRVMPAPATRIVAEAISSVPAVVVTASRSVAIAAPVEPFAIPWSRIALGIWLLGTVLCTLRFGWGLLRARGLVRRAVRGADDTRTTREVSGPLVAGVISPVILLPVEASAWASDFRAAVLAHESAHVRRRDGLAMAIGHLACSLYWFNPLAWFALVQLRRECELAADEDAIASGIRPTSYAKHLLATARSQPLGSGVLAMSHARSELALRIETLITRDALPRRSPSQTACVCAGAVALFAGAACSSTANVPVTATSELRASAPAGVDARLQKILDEEALRAKTAAGARRVALVAVDTTTGNVVAMHDDRPGEPIVPASTLKPLVVAIALDARAIDREERFDCGNGVRTYGSESIQDWSPNAMLDATQILAVSSNVGMTRIYDKLGAAALTEGLERFRLVGTTTVTSGDAPVKRDDGLRGAMKALGLDVLTLPVAIASAYTVLANDGVRIKTSGDGRTSRERVIRDDSARAVRAMLEEAVHGKSATGGAAQIASARVAGKTGTTDGGQRFASFVGMVPAEHPRYVIYVGIASASEGTGGSLAAPVFARIAARALDGG